MAIFEEVKKDYGKLKLYINGEWVDSKSKQILENPNPATGEAIATFPIATNDEVDAAVAAAQSALAVWKNVPLRDKARYLFDLRGKFDERADYLARILVQDHGRTMGEARGTIRRCIENIESAAAALLLMTKGDYVPDLAKGLDQTLYWEPRGVFSHYYPPATSPCTPGHPTHPTPLPAVAPSSSAPATMSPLPPGPFSKYLTNSPAFLRV